MRTLHPGLRDTEAMTGLGIFHSRCPPKQILLFKIPGVVCILMLLLHLGSQITLLTLLTFPLS